MEKRVRTDFVLDFYIRTYIGDALNSLHSEYLYTSNDLIAASEQAFGLIKRDCYQVIYDEFVNMARYYKGQKVPSSKYDGRFVAVPISLFEWFKAKRKRIIPPKPKTMNLYMVFLIYFVEMKNIMVDFEEKKDELLSELQALIVKRFENEGALN